MTRAEKKVLRNKVREFASEMLNGAQLAIEWKEKGLSEEEVGYACGYLMYLADSLKVSEGDPR